MGYVRQPLQLVGLAPDVLPSDAPANVWTFGDNVHFRNGETRRTPGDLKVMGNTMTVPECMVSYTDAVGQNFWVYAGQGGIFCTDGATHSNITPAGWGTPIRNASWTAEAWNGLVIINHSSMMPVWWNGNPASICVPLPGFTSSWRCMAVRGFREFLFAVGMVDSGGGQRMRWSDAAQPGAVPQLWTPAAGNLAGFFDLMPSTSAVYDAAQMQGNLIAMKGESFHLISYVGGNAVFMQQELFRGVGIMGPNAWCKGPNDELLWMTAGADIHITDGVTHASVLDGKARKKVMDEISNSALFGVCGATLSREGVGVIGYPAEGFSEATIGFIYDWASGAIGFRQLGQVNCMAQGRLLADPTGLTQWDTDAGSWDSDGTVWNYTAQAATLGDLIQGSATGLVAFSEQSGSLLVGAATYQLNANAYRAGLAFGKPELHKLIVRAWPNIKGTVGDVLTFRFGAQEAADGPVEWGPDQTYTIGSGEPIDTFTGGRFLAVQVQSVAGNQWVMGSLGLDMRLEGRF